MGKWHGSQASPRMHLRWWNPTSGRVLQREPITSAPGGRAAPRYRSFGLCRDRLSSFPRPTSLHGLGSGCLNLGKDFFPHRTRYVLRFNTPSPQKNGFSFLPEKTLGKTATGQTHRSDHLHHGWPTWPTTAFYRSTPEACRS